MLFLESADICFITLLAINMASFLEIIVDGASRRSMVKLGPNPHTYAGEPQQGHQEDIGPHQARKHGRRVRRYGILQILEFFV
jgi:hypothetical protein